MADILCIIMGIMDILAGILIIWGFGSHILGVLLGIVMIGKGGFSFIG
jgi:hypothetical protein